MTKSIQHKFFFPNNPEIVWEYLTKAELIELWLMKNDFQPIIGHDFQFRTKPMPGLNLDGIFYCKVLEMIPFKKLTYSWKGGPGNDNITLDTIVEWNLYAKDNGTELLLKHSGFDEIENLSIYSGMNEGW
ncbi:MAG TPA: SRPBCC domain-containing protein, partial [Flavisolibacter sp.]|nr:SRPBCC domain-containing protein [Flavisolibacter sp.]